VKHYPHPAADPNAPIGPPSYPPPGYSPGYGQGYQPYGPGGETPKLKFNHGPPPGKFDPFQPPAEVNYDLYDQGGYAASKARD